jgi:cation:H+ antiporter
MASPGLRALGLALALAGVALMAGGGWLAVGGAERVVAALRLTDTAVGLTLLALATTAELFALAWAAMRRGVSEIAVAGVVGSVAYNATASLGVAALVRPLAVSGILVPAIAAAALPLVLLAVTPGGRLSRPAGAVLVIGYAAWVASVLAR